jgi:hypothetical protein
VLSEGRARPRCPPVRTRQLFVAGSCRPTGEFRPHWPRGTVPKIHESRTARMALAVQSSSRQMGAGCPGAPAWEA